MGGLLVTSPALSGVVMESGDNSMYLDNNGENRESGDSLLGTPPPNPEKNNWDYYEMGLPWGIVPEVHIPWYPPGNRPRPPHWGQKPPGAPFPPGSGWRPPYGQQRPPGISPGRPGSGGRPPQWGYKPPGYSPGEYGNGWRPPHGAQKPSGYPPSRPNWRPSKPQTPAKPSEQGRPSRPLERPGKPYGSGTEREMK